MPTYSSTNDISLRDWPSRFRQLELQEMRYDIQMIECHLPSPWYRYVADVYVLQSILAGIVGPFFGILCESTTVDAWWTYAFIVGGILDFLSGWLLLIKYDKWTGDVSLILDKEMYRMEEERAGLFASHSVINDHTEVYE